MDPAGRTAAFFLLIALTSTAARAFTLPTPTLLWANTKLFGEKASGVNYATIDLMDMWNGLSGSWKNSNGKSEFTSGSEKPSIAVLFAGRQLHPQDLGSLEAEPSMKSLQKALAASESSLLLPNLQTEDELNEFVGTVAESSNVKVVGTCGSDSEDVDIGASIEKILSESASDSQGTKVVVVCSTDSLESEMSDLGKVTSILDNQAKDYAFVYVSYDPSSDEGEDEVKSQKRRLLETSEEWIVSYDECDELCLTQVKFLEAIILALVLVFALGSGLCCTHILDGPSQFEASEQDS